jgi:uncharacterized pyridoxamine 5'-phosphate oxidase family protein
MDMFTAERPKLAKGVNDLSQRERRIYDFLKANPAGVLSTVDPDGDPHGTVIYYDVDTSFCTYFLTKTETRKYDDIKHYDHVMLTVFEPKYQSVAQVAGIASELTDSTEINRIAGAAQTASLKTSRSGLPPISKLTVGGYTAFAVKPVQIRMAVYFKPGVNRTNGIFESIESFDWQRDA